MDDICWMLCRYLETAYHLQYSGAIEWFNVLCFGDTQHDLVLSGTSIYHAYCGLTRTHRTFPLVKTHSSCSRSMEWTLVIYRSCLHVFISE